MLTSLEIRGYKGRRERLQAYYEEHVSSLGRPEIDVNLTTGFGHTLRFNHVREATEKDRNIPISSQYVVVEGDERVRKIQTESSLLVIPLENLEDKSIQQEWGTFLNGMVNGESLVGFPSYAFRQNLVQVEILELVISYARTSTSHVSLYYPYVRAAKSVGVARSSNARTLSYAR